MKQNMTILQDPWFTVKQIARNITLPTPKIFQLGKFKLYILQLTHQGIFVYTIMKLRFYLQEIYFMKARFLRFIRRQIL